MGKYVEEGRIIRRMMEDLTPQVQPLSIDEAFMDLTGTEALHGGSPAQSLIKLQNRIWEERRLTVSIGLQFNKFLAKTASDLDKPRGFSVIGRGEALAFLESRSVGTLPGVGPAGATALERNGLKKIGDIRAVGPQRMRALYGDWGAQLFALSMADDPRKVDPRRRAQEHLGGNDVLRGRQRHRSAGRHPLAALREGRRALPRQRDSGADADAQAQGHEVQDHHAPPPTAGADAARLPHLRRRARTTGGRRRRQDQVSADRRRPLRFQRRCKAPTKATCSTPRRPSAPRWRARWRKRAASSAATRCRPDGH